MEGLAMPEGRRARILIAASAAALAAGCGTTGPDAYFRAAPSRASVYVAAVPSPIEKIAVMPFKAPTELIGSAVSDLFGTELLRSGRYTCVERSQMAQVLSETELAMAGVSVDKALKVGTMVGADGVVLGTVDEYSLVAQRGRSIPVVGVTVRLIDCRTGSVMWSADFAGRAEDSATTLPEQARKVIHEIASGLYQNWRVQRRIPRGQAAAIARVESNPHAPVRRNVVPDSATDEMPGRVAAVAPLAPPPPLEPPAGVTLSDLGLREVRIQWPTPPDPGLRYRIERAPERTGPFAVVADVPASRRGHVDAGGPGAPLADAATYYYRLTALAADGRASAPGPVAESLTAPPPDPPDGLVAEAPAARAVKLAWKPSAAPGVTAYAVERADPDLPDEFHPAGRASGTTFAEGGTAASPLADRSTYRYRVRAVNRVGAVGPPGEPVGVTTRPPPGPVAGLQALGGQVRSVPLAWSASEEADVAAYELFRSTGDARTFEPLVTLKGRSSTAHVDGGREPGTLADATTYRYRVRAINAVGAIGGDSEVATATTRVPPPPVEAVRVEGGRPREVALA
jgi:TolB-like protein